MSIALLAPTLVLWAAASVGALHPAEPPVTAAPTGSTSAVPGDPGTLTPGDGLGLATEPVGRSPGQRRPMSGLPVGGLGMTGAVLAGAVLRRHGTGRRRRSTASGPIFVYVPGHGGDPGGFADLAGRMGIDPTGVRVFDYRWAWPSDDALEASRRAPTSDAADALNAYLAALGEEGRTIYLVGHSKGGAVISEVIARWDEHPDLVVHAVSGATLLDPPIAAGPLGALQSVGWFHPGTADDGLFDPVRCGIGGCHDVRVGLGERSGVEVVVVRNPDARLTNLPGRPDRLRVYDLDDGEGDMLARFPNVFGMWRRMSEAHNSVLHDDTVAACISAEATSAGSCRWPSHGSSRGPSHTQGRGRARVRWGRGRSGNGPVVR